MKNVERAGTPQGEIKAGWMGWEKKTFYGVKASLVRDPRGTEKKPNLDFDAMLGDEKYRGKRPSGERLDGWGKLYLSGGRKEESNTLDTGDEGC